MRLLFLAPDPVAPNRKTAAPRSVERRIHVTSIRIRRAYVQPSPGQSIGGMLNEKRPKSWIAAR